MIKKTLFFQNPCHISTKHQQLVITNKETGEINKRSVEDVGFIVLDNPQISITQSVVQLLAANNAAVIFCDETHHPASMLFHLDSHQTQTEHFRAQIDATEPLKKRLWQQTVKAKIKNQAALLDIANPPDGGNALRYMARQVKSGDAENQESRASRFYWSKIFGEKFSRHRFGEPPNNFLNYGYAILRAGVARALTGSGLLPTLGIHHRNKYNAYCLADDIMEPYRPYVDYYVREIHEAGQSSEDISTEIKRVLLEILSCDVEINGKNRPLMTGLSETTASLVRCFKGEEKTIRYPEL